MKVLRNIILTIIGLGLLLFIISFGLVAVRTLDTRIDYEDEIIKYADLYKSDPLMIASIINVESGFDKDAVSHLGAKGLMQIIPETGQWVADHLEIDYENELLFDPDYNIKLGAYYYEYLYEYYGSIDLALAAYNGGMGNVDSWLDDEEYSKDGHKLDYIPFEETRQYVDKVKNVYDTYSFLYEDSLPEEVSDFELVWKNYKTFISDITKSF